MTDNDAGSPPVGSADVADFSDADLVLRTRSGDRTAFGELWRRHYRSGVTVARSVTSSLDPDDLVQEAYTRIYQSILTGGGPTGSFRAYLFTSIRNTAATWGRARRETAIEALDAIEDPATSDEATTQALDRGLTHQAFRSLPTRWQEVLWYSEIEQLKPAEIAPLLGMKATAVAQLTFRAREGLREAWIQAHLRSVADGSDCQWTIEHLGAYARANIGRRDRAKLEAHLARCARCSIVASEAKEVSGRLALVLVPLTVGAVGTAGYLASLQGGAVHLTALAAMPASVAPALATGAGAAGSVGVAGAGSAAAVSTSVAASAGTAVAAGAASTSIAAGASSAVAAGAVSTAVAAGAGSAIAAGAGAAAAAGGILSGIGAMTGLAAAGLAVITTVVAAAIALPALVPSAGVAPDTGIAPDTGTSIVLQQDTTAIPPAESVDAATSEEPPAAVDAAIPPAGDATATSATADAPAGVAVEPEVPAAAEAEAAAEARAEVPAAAHPETPSPAQPAHPVPAPGHGASDPQPGGPGPALPEVGLAIVAGSSAVLPETGLVDVAIVVSGMPGATVQARLRGVVRATAVVGDAGTATVIIQPTDQELQADSRVELRYADGHSGAPVSARLSDLL